MNSTVPAMRHPDFDVEDGVALVPVNRLVDLGCAPERFTVIGAGKTGLDACLWLLNHGVDPDGITWIASRDAWLVNRGQENQADSRRLATELQACQSADDAISALEQLGAIIRRDPEVTPSAFRCATVSAAELAQLRLPCLLAPSAAVTGKLKCLGLDDDTRSGLAPPALNPNTSGDLLAFHGIRMDRLHRWSDSPELFEWLLGPRLSAALPDLPKMKDQGNRATAALLAAHLEDLLKKDGTPA
ncbi:hypothetical protein ACWD4G_40055 [Streptomyces sp. NPDC002643]